MAAAVQIVRVHYRYPGGDWALKGLELILDAGHYTVVFGANGSGKSTFAYLPNGLIPHFLGGELQGTVSVAGLDTRRADVGQLFERVGLMLQNTDAQLFSSTVEDEIAFGLESLGLAGKTIEARIGEVARALGIERLLSRAPETLSGGERRLAALASVLGADPPILVLDEPFSNLDWKYTRKVAMLLAAMHRAGKTIVVIEQNNGSFLRDATRLVVMDAGRCAFSGEPAEGSQTREFTRLVPQYLSRPFPSASADGEPFLSVEHLGCRFGEKEILRDVSFTLQSGETAAIVGENGAGKTTLLRHLNGLLRPTAGEVRLYGESIRSHPVAELAGRVGLCFQNPNDQFFKPTVREEVQVGQRRGRPSGEGLCEDLCRLFRLSSLLDRPPQQLSEGEKKRVAIASVMAMDPELLVLDEPTAGQDAISREALAGQVAHLSAQGKAVLLATHDLEFAEACSQRWLLLHEGRITADGSPGQIRSLIFPNAPEPTE
ncbi:MAG: ABC transporter ATP-binding protein [Hyphomicrobiales bacterium]